MPISQTSHWILSLSSSFCPRSAKHGNLPLLVGRCWAQVGTAQLLQRAHYSSPSTQYVKKLLVANRGEIACRVLTTARKLGIPSVAVFSEADARSKHIELADESYNIGGAAARDSYLRADAILDVAYRTGATAVHPGYGFLSENAPFAEACAAAGVAFVGPPGAAIRAMGDKARAKALMQAAGVPVVPGYHGEDQSEERLVEEAGRIGYPLLVKAVSGGGGKGMKLAVGPEGLLDAIRSARREAGASFGDERLLLERYITRPRHVEVQLIADSHGNAVYLYDRDCSLQRRHQKVIEEAPAPGLPEAVHRRLGEAAVRAARAVGYVNAGTVEFILDTDSPEQEFYFMEMNTRLQVEHPVSEAITGVDLVDWQLRVAGGGRLPLSQSALPWPPRGHAFEARIYAERPRSGFLPGAGTVRRWRTPSGAAAFEVAPLRVDSGVREGDTVGTLYDPMIAKLVTHGSDRQAALDALVQGLRGTQVSGLPTNVPFLLRLAAHPAFAAARPADLHTAFIPQRQEELLAPQRVPAEVSALAAVARHLLTVRQQVGAVSYENSSNGGGGDGASAGQPRPMGPWDAGDSRRLWHAHRRTALVRHPEGGPGAGLRLTLAVLGGGEFQVQSEPAVVRVPGEEVEDEDEDATNEGEEAAKPQPAPAPASPATPAVTVRGAALTAGGDTLVAEVGVRRCTAQVLMYASGGGAGLPAEHTLDVWTEGEHYQFTWTEPVWSRMAPHGDGHHGPTHGSHAHHGGGGRGAVSAPMPGQVVAVAAAEGQRVRAGAPLVTLEAMKMEHAVSARHAGVVVEVRVAAGTQVAAGQVLVVVQPDDKQPGKGEGKSV